ncbi:MAG: phosphomannomutase/phosphoglucomutase [Nitrospina sp.]|jgi:phosphomannomutase / phosphoglucomutase|nr:phosphomannomutase/phosphoglucomutase [Nitrospina sp.]MBT3876183.1 phosphomannomutase/phosphoglucomutase [Nitrospina sp.]MBT4047795.1 phosphomannomutase/phosphoglucomutase [Nitrospina sp.]MBT4558644.1 phosphomannomutase/phosphoglucomutase [Nitrospina sp.]MBT5349251.1 phosphomannomutase/phosphoglucomutase [Nitrospina sp.]
MTTEINPQIFREYDIRGVVGPDLTPETVQYIGQAIGTYMKRQGGKTLVMGWDIRSSSIEFRDILSKALTSTGCDVVDIGKVPTPVSYFALHHLKADGGVMITGSHNPPEFNGFKISQGQNSLYGEKIQELKKMIDAKDFETGSGKVEQANIMESYMDHICSILNISRKVKVVVDGGNGCFGIVGPELLRKLGQEPIEIFCEPDGTFPNHHPDPTVEKNLEGLIQKVRAENAELGIGFDGDADRIGLVDEKGNILWGDQLLTIFARDILSRNPGATIVGEVKCSQNLYQDIEKHGGVPVMAPAGHSLIKKKMKETGALLAGEMSGHVCFADNYLGFDDAIFAAGRILQIVAQSSQKVSEMLADLPKTAYTPEIRIDCPDDRKFEIVSELTELFRKQYEVIDIDGVRVNFGDGWALIRASNTQPVLVLRFEAETQARLKELVAIIKKQMDHYQPVVQFDYQA